MKEAPFQRWVIDLAHIHGWRVAHFRPAMVRAGRTVTPVGADGSGFPDLCMARKRNGKGRLVFAELKRSGVRRLRPDQILWQEILGGDGWSDVEHYVWNPSDRPLIEEVLR